MFWLPELLLWELKLILLVVGGRKRGTRLNQLCEELSRPSSPVAGENYKTKTLTVSGNSPNGIQQMEEHLFKKIYSILERPASLWHLNHSLLPSYTLLPIQSDECLLPAGVRKKTVPLFTPQLSVWGPGFCSGGTGHQRFSSPQLCAANSLFQASTSEIGDFFLLPVSYS